MDKDTTPAPVSGDSLTVAANATEAATDKVEDAATKVEGAASGAGDDETRKSLREINDGLKGLTGTLDTLAQEIRAMKPAKADATPEASSEPTESMGEPDVPASPAPPEKVKKGTYHTRKAKVVAKRGGKK